LNRALNVVMFVMISAILLAWAPTSAYAGLASVHIETEDRKGNAGLNFDCFSDNFTIDINGKGTFEVNGGGPSPIPPGTGSIVVEFNFDGTIAKIQFNKHNGSLISENIGPFDTPLVIHAKIASKTICGEDIPKGTTSLTLSVGGTD